MDRRNEARVAFYAPNILNICVDEYENGDFSGRMFHRYAKEPQIFRSVIDLTNQMEAFFDSISFPQAAMQTRSFADVEKSKHRKTQEETRTAAERPRRRAAPEKIVSLEDLTANRGAKGTFYISVRYRQNACWQGDLEWAEREKTERFVSLLDMIKLINNAVEDAPERV